MTIYSKRLWYGGFGLAGSMDSEPVPANHVWVVREMSMYNPDLHSVNGNDGFNVFGGAGEYIWTMGTGQTLYATQYRWQGRAVIEALEVITISVSEGGWQFSVYGYDLA